VLPRPHDSKAIAKTQSKGLCRCLYAIIFGHRWTKIASWERFHGGWPMVIIQHLRKQLPRGMWPNLCREVRGTRSEMNTERDGRESFVWRHQCGQNSGARYVRLHIPGSGECHPQAGAAGVDRADSRSRGGHQFRAGITPTTDLRRVPGLLDQTLIAWLKANPKFKVISTLPIVEEGNTVAIHVWFRA
jgi:hypothetical protein